MISSSPTKLKLILASRSPQRKIMLETVGIPFEIVPAEIDEKQIRDANLARQAEAVAAAKAAAISHLHSQATIIAADTFVSLNHQTLEKPTTPDEARDMLHNQSGQTITVYTGFCYLDPHHHLTDRRTVLATATLRSLEESEIDHYIQTQPVTTWSAGFAPAYPAGMALVASFAGSLTAFSHGLPMEVLVPLLKKSRFLK